MPKLPTLKISQIAAVHVFSQLQQTGSRNTRLVPNEASFSFASGLRSEYSFPHLTLAGFGHNFDRSDVPEKGRHSTRRPMGGYWSRTWLERCRRNRVKFLYIGQLPSNCLLLVAMLSL